MEEVSVWELHEKYVFEKRRAARRGEGGGDSEEAAEEGADDAEAAEENAESRGGATNSAGGDSNGGGGGGGGSASSRPLRPDSNHPLRATHHYRLLRRPRIPKILGGRLPDFDALPNDPQEDTAEQATKREKYAVSALVLFKPLRGAEDLRGSAASWYDALLAFLAEAESPAVQKAREILYNMQAWWTCKTAAAREREARVHAEPPAPAPEMRNSDLPAAYRVNDPDEDGGGPMRPGDGGTSHAASL